MPITDQFAASVTALSKVYPGGRVALSGVTLAIEQRTVTAIAGPNGSGKTTLLRILAGMLAPTSGSIEVLGANPTVAAASVRSRIAFASQEIALDPEMTGAQTLRLFGALYGVPRHRLGAEIDSLAASFQLVDHLHRRVQSFSGGLRRRLHLAIAFLQNPDLLLLDEPTAGLDPSGRQFLWGLLRARAQRAGSVLLVTHDLQEAEQFCDRVAILARGSVLTYGAPAELIRAHSGRMIELTLQQPIGIGDPRLSDLASLDGVAAVRMLNERLLIDLREGRENKQRVLSALGSTGLDVTRFTVREPDLSMVYFRLTGESSRASPSPSRATDRGSRPGGGRYRQAEL
jgi:ABC-2 type transport system ATP-binding protein